SVVNQSFAEILLTGELFDGRDGPVSFAAGLTYREQDFFDHALPREIDMLGPVVNVPELGIRGAGPIATGGSANLHAFSTLPMMDGEYDVWEWFGELNAPLWSSAVGVQWLSASVAFRQSNYSSLDEPIDSWKVGLDFQMLEDLRLRVTRSRDVREATFAERFDAQASGISVTDPRFNNEIVAITAVTGGNPALIPESADTVVAGFVYQPRWIEGLSASV